MLQRSNFKIHLYTSGPRVGCLKVQGRWKITYLQAMPLRCWGRNPLLTGLPRSPEHQGNAAINGPPPYCLPIHLLSKPANKLLLDDLPTQKFAVNYIHGLRKARADLIINKINDITTLSYQWRQEIQRRNKFSFCSFYLQRILESYIYNNIMAPANVLGQ